MSLGDYAEPQDSVPCGRAPDFVSRTRAFLSEAVSRIPNGTSISILAEQESAMTAEEGALEKCLDQCFDGDKDLAASFLLLFISALKRWHDTALLRN